MRLAKTVFALVVLSLAACTVDRPLPPLKDSDHASIKLAEAANSVSRSLSELARIQAAATPPAKGHRLLEAEKLGIRQTASVDWAGPIEPLVRKLGGAISYRIRVLGTKPAVPVIISLTTKQAPIANILRDIDFQAGHRANVHVYPKSKVVELRYAKT